MPEKRQPASATCRFSAAYYDLEHTTGFSGSEKSSGKKKRQPSEVSRFLMTPTHHFAW
jgi:hypothetical protein